MTGRVIPMRDTLDAIDEKTKIKAFLLVDWSVR